MSLVKTIFIAAALAALYYYLPPLLASASTATIACLVAMCYIGFVMGEAIEFCIDRYKVAKRL